MNKKYKIMQDKLAIELMEKLNNKYNMNNMLSLDEYVCEYWNLLNELERSQCIEIIEMESLSY